MKTGRLCLVLLAALTLSAAFPIQADEGDEATAVRKTIEDAYVKGIHIERDIPGIRKGFHPSFTMFIRNGEDVRTLSLDEWIKSIEKKKNEDPKGPDYKVTHEIPMVDVIGDAAVAKVLIYRDSKLIYSDYMSLYKFEDGWKIVGKIYYSHKD